MLRAFDFDKDMSALVYNGRKNTMLLMWMWQSCCQLMELLENEPACRHDGALPHPYTMAYCNVDWCGKSDAVQLLIADACESHGIKRIVVNRHYPFMGIYDAELYLYQVAHNAFTWQGVTNDMVDYYELLFDNVRLELDKYHAYHSSSCPPLGTMELEALRKLAYED